MTMAPYVCISCFATGAPWSEQKQGMTYDEFMAKSFGFESDWGTPTQGQDQEFCCAHPSRNGSNSLLKGLDACLPAIADQNVPRETGRVIIAIRGLLLSTNAADSVYYPVSSSPTDFWFAVRTPKEIVIEAELGNDRQSPYRRRPYEIVAFLDSA